MSVPSAFGISALYCLSATILVHPDSVMTEGTDNLTSLRIPLKNQGSETAKTSTQWGETSLSSPALWLNLAKIPVQLTTLLPKSLFMRSFVVSSLPRNYSNPPDNQAEMNRKDKNKVCGTSEKHGKKFYLFFNTLDFKCSYNLHF